MSSSKTKTLTIFIGRDMDADDAELFSGKSLSEINQPRNALYLDSFEQLRKLLSPKRLDLLRFLIEYKTKPCTQSVSSVAKSLHRHQEAVSRDLSSLKKLGCIELKRVKQKVRALPKYARIDIRMR